MAAPKKPQGPLDWRVPITNKDGTPTNEFMRKWNLQVGINTGIPTTPEQLSAILDLLGVDQGDIIYRDVDQWKVLEAGAARTLLTSEGASANPNWVALSAHLDDLGSARGDLIYRAASAWATLAASTPGDILVTEGTGGDPLWATIAAVLDFISSTRGSVLFRGASGWTVLTPGTSGNVLTTHGAGADPTWTAAAGGGVTSFFGTGAPVTLHTNGDLYFDTTTAPYVEYVQNAGAWVQVAGGTSGTATIYARPVGQAAWSSSATAFATKGNYLKPVETIVVDAVYVGMGSGATGRVIEVTINQLTTATSGIVSVVAGRASAVTVGTAAVMLKITFASPVTMVAGQGYIVAVSQTNAATGVTALGIQAVGTGVNGFPNYNSLPLDNTQLLNNENYQLAKTSVAVADTFVLNNNAAYDIMLSVQLSASATFAPAGAAHLTYATPAGAPGAAALLALDTGYLSDVSTGVWTPTVSFGGASVGVTYSSQTGTFTKIGKLVVLNWRVALLTKGVSTGVVTVDGLPFTPAVNTFSNGFINSGTALPVQIMTMVQVGVASSRHVYNNGTVIASLDDTNITNASVFTGTSIFSVP